MTDKEKKQWMDDHGKYRADLFIKIIDGLDQYKGLDFKSTVKRLKENGYFSEGDWGMYEMKHFKKMFSEKMNATTQKTIKPKQVKEKPMKVVLFKNRFGDHKVFKFSTKEEKELAIKTVFNELLKDRTFDDHLGISRQRSLEKLYEIDRKNMIKQAESRLMTPKEDLEKIYDIFVPRHVSDALKIAKEKNLDEAANGDIKWMEKFVLEVSNENSKYCGNEEEIVFIELTLS
jgi:hypothetical protein